MRTDRLWQLLSMGAFVAVFEDLRKSRVSDETEARDETDIIFLMDEMDEAARDNYDMEDADTVCDIFHGGPID
jgi:hypothetical protein